MCHDDESVPPAPPNPGPVRRHGPLELTSTDGNRIPAYEAVPETTSRGALILFPDRRGLLPFYFLLAQQFASAGFHTVAFDYFSRTADSPDRTGDFSWAEHGTHLKPEHVEADARAVAAYLREAAPGEPLFDVGFCMGGGHAWRLAGTDVGLTASIGLYGIPRMAIEAVDRFNAPLLILAAGGDVVAPVAAFEELAAVLTEHGKEFEMHVIPDAPHAFFDDHFSEWTDACNEAWRLMLDFVDVQLSSRV